MGDIHLRSVNIYNNLHLSHDHKNIIIMLAIPIWPGDIPYFNLPNTVILPRILSGYRLSKPEMCPEEM